ncbi:hypothetical protein CKAN_01354700 [Cinnamomum micranthum f. kanehirae]|uniref:Uncharacterized protein n=1 Tax=Cinnamomum micranthum f. kanehirae TaxID=337451 RepID=A0A3S3QI28_9MAGN|nr:hypothetical protein CKAN_01354700 [Cinnamomum micranthum f. kanehirae]
MSRMQRCPPRHEKPARTVSPIRICVVLILSKCLQKLNYRSGGSIQCNSPRILLEIFKIDVEIRKLKLFELLYP